MPITFSRKHFDVVRRPGGPEYFVSEKTDGLRFLLLVAPEGCFLIDRKYSFYQVQYIIFTITHNLQIDTPNALYKLLSPDRQSLTLLDGELIRHIGTKKVVFLMFDLISLKGKYYGDMYELYLTFTHFRLLGERLKALYEHVIMPCRNMGTRMRSASGSYYRFWGRCSPVRDSEEELSEY